MEVVRLWTGAGDAYAALGSVEPAPESIVHEWSPAAVRDRARRLGFAQLIAALSGASWPTTVAPWREALPAESVRPWVFAEHPPAAIDWVATRRLGAWPPSEFVGRPRLRVPQTLLASTLRWCLEEIDELRGAALRIEASAADREPPGLSSALALLLEPPLEAVQSVRPTRSELRSVRREGWPWTALATASEELLRQADLGVEALAQELLAPDPEIEWRLFHLAVFGEILLGLRDAGAEIRSVRPLGVGSGPVHEVRVDESAWDLWFEAGGLAAHYGGSSAYAAVAAQLRRRPRPLQPDVALVRRQDRYTRIWECKFSIDDAYLRSGALQSMAYLTEVAGAVGVPPSVSLTVPDPAARAVAATVPEPGTVRVEAAGAVREGARILVLA